jgi:exodeoxyribonuclease VII small subunit
VKYTPTLPARADASRDSIETGNTRLRGGARQLESIVQRLEQGELSLEESLRQFERGVVLTRSCQKALRQAEQKIQVLTRDAGGELVERDFDAPDAD